MHSSQLMLSLTLGTSTTNATRMSTRKAMCNAQCQTVCIYSKRSVIMVESGIYSENGSSTLHRYVD